MRPDKKKIVDEVWDETRVKSFLGKRTPTQSGKPFPGDADFHTLLNAYYAMRVDDFERFLRYFIESGGDIDAKSGDGKTLAEHLSRHKQAGPFIEALRGAERNAAPSV